MIIPRLIILRIIKLSDEVVEKIKIHVLCSITFLITKITPFVRYFGKKKNRTAGQARDDNTILRMRFACWIINPIDTHSEYVIHIAFPLQQWLHERASVLRLYVNCRSCHTSICNPQIFL